MVVRLDSDGVIDGIKELRSMYAVSLSWVYCADCGLCFQAVVWPLQRVSSTLFAFPFTKL